MNKLTVKVGSSLRFEFPGKSPYCKEGDHKIGFECTLSPGHEGPHMASGPVVDGSVEVYSIWD